MGTAPSSGKGGIGPSPTTDGECTASAPTRKPGPAHHASAHAATVGAKNAWAATISALSTADEAPSSSWIPAILPQPATRATTARTDPAAARYPAHATPVRTPPPSHLAAWNCAARTLNEATVAQALAAKGRPRAPGAMLASWACGALRAVRSQEVKANAGMDSHREARE